MTFYILIYFLTLSLNLSKMETLRVEILNPKAKRLLKDMEDLKLISIGKLANPKVEFKNLLSKLRANPGTMPSLDEITKEVESVRALRYENKTK